MQNFGALNFTSDKLLAILNPFSIMKRVAGATNHFQKFGA
jgi:hypothetical protein